MSVASRRDVFIGIDQGTSSCKAIAVDTGGIPCAMGVGSYELYLGTENWAEQAPADWWQGCVQACREVAAELPSDCHVVGVGTCGTMPGHVFLAEDGTVEPRAMVWLDGRATAEAQWIRETFTEDVLERAIGARLPVVATMPPARMVWFPRHRPQLLGGGWHMLQAKDYLNYRLTGAMATDHTSNLGLINIETRVADDAFLAALGVSRTLLPPACEPFEVIGTITALAARETGLDPGTPVVAGWIDAFANMLGSGLRAPLEALDVGGTSEIVGLATRKVTEQKVHPGVLALPLYGGLSVVYGLTNSGADAVRWFAESFGFGDSRDAFRVFEREAMGVDPGSGGLVFLPYISGERSPVWDETATGVFVGCRRSQKRSHFARAVVEGTAHSVRQILALCSQAAGGTPEVVHVSGGSARSAVTNQVKADVLGVPVVEMAVTETAALGAAMLAAVGCGVQPDCQTAAANMATESRWFEPRPQYQRIYEDAHEIYVALYPLLHTLKVPQGSIHEGKCEGRD